MLTTINISHQKSSNKLVFLGVGDDGKPLHLHLNNLLSGSMLISSKFEQIEMFIIQTLISSVLSLFKSYNSEFIVITEHANKWAGLNIQQQLKIKNWGMANSANLLQDLAKETAERMDGAKKEPVVFLFIDDLSKSLDLDYQIRETLMWLIFYGPKVKIWPIAILKNAHIAQFVDWLDLFNFILVDDILTKKSSNNITENLVRIYHTGKWRTFRIPD